MTPTVKNDEGRKDDGMKVNVSDRDDEDEVQHGEQREDGVDEDEKTRAKHQWQAFDFLEVQSYAMVLLHI